MVTFIAAPRALLGRVWSRGSHGLGNVCGSKASQHVHVEVPRVGRSGGNVIPRNDRESNWGVRRERHSQSVASVALRAVGGRQLSVLPYRFSVDERRGLLHQYW